MSFALLNPTKLYFFVTLILEIYIITFDINMFNTLDIYKDCEKKNNCKKLMF